MIISRRNHPGITGKHPGPPGRQVPGSCSLSVLLLKQLYQAAGKDKPLCPAGIFAGILAECPLEGERGYWVVMEWERRKTPPVGMTGGAGVVTDCRLLIFSPFLSLEII
jgi:hypothetical protein